MENKSHALLAGIFTIAMLCAAILVAIWLNRDKSIRTEYLIVTNKPISGLNPQASVRYKGLVVGRVDKINFDHSILGQINIQISIDPETPITQSTFATLGYQGVTGIAFVQLDDDGSNLKRLTSTAGEIPHIPLHPSLFDRLEQRGTIILANVELASSRLAQLLTPENQKTILDAFSSTTQLTGDWTKVANDLKPTLKQMPGIAEKANQTLSSMQALADNATQLSQQLTSLTNQLQDPEGPLNQTLSSFGTLGNRMQSDILPKITVLTSETTNTMRTLNKTLEGISDNPQDLIFGKPAPQPGPGEAGFVHPK